MLRSRAAVVAGVLFVLMVFAYGTETGATGLVDFSVLEERKVKGQKP